MLEHEPIKIKDEVMENGSEKVTNCNKGQDDHKATTETEESSVWIGRVEVIELEANKYIQASKNLKPPKNGTTNRYLENKNNCLENNEQSENEINCKNVTISCRQRNDYTCNKVSIIASNKDTKSCGNICAFHKQKKLVFNCKFCDLNYGDMDNFKSHLHEDHNMFHLEVHKAQENAPRILRKKIEQNIKFEYIQGTSSTTEPLDYCGNVFILNQREWFIVCGSCETKYDSLDLFEKHLRQQHHIFISRLIKSEASRKTVNTTDTYESYTETLNLTDPIKLDKEIVLNTVQLTPSKRSATKRKCTIKNNKNQQYSTRPEIKLEHDLYQTAPQKTPTQIDKRRIKTIKATMKNNILSRIALDEPIPEVLSYGDQTNEENIQEEHSLLKELFEEQTPKRILKTDSKRFKCNECDKQFLKLTKFNEHKQRHFKDKKYTCRLCELPFFSKKELSLHMRQHSTDRRFKCSQCSKGFERNSDLMIHVRVHTGEKPFVCDICNKCFRAKQNLSVHRKFHMGEASKTYECEHCDKKFIRNIDCKTHMRTHTGEKPYKCDICDRGYSSKVNVRAHFQRDHISGKVRKKAGPNSKALKEELNKQKKLIEELQQQLLPQIKPDEKIVPTELKWSHLSKGFERNSDLKIHVRLHTEDKPFACDICNKCFRAKQNLSVHRKSHMGEASKTYECEHCDKKFLRNIDRKTHMRSHTGEKPFKCEICERGYSSKVNVRAHMERDHISGNGRRKPGPKALKEEVDKQNKLIEELQLQLQQQIETDEKIIPTE